MLLTRSNYQFTTYILFTLSLQRPRVMPGQVSRLPRAQLEEPDLLWIHFVHNVKYSERSFCT